MPHVAAALILIEIGDDMARYVLCKCAAMSAKKNGPRWIQQLKAIGKRPAPRAQAASATH